MAFKQVFNLKYRPIFIAALGIIIAVLINWLTNLYSPDILKNYFGDDYKLILLLITVLFILFLFLLTHQHEKDKTGNATESTVSKDMLSADDYDRAYQKLKSSLADQYLNRIQSKLAFPMPINIGGKPTHFGTSEGYINNYQLNKDLTIEPVDLSNSINKILDSHGRLLLIGDAGSGKTVILLMAARFILADKEASELPLMLNLATWRSNYAFDEWYERNIAESFNLSRPFAKTLIKKRAIIPFFDGYDEIIEIERANLLQQMRTYFGSDKANRFIISSRKLAYQDAAEDAPVYAEYEVKPLTIAQIRTALTGNATKFGSENAFLNTIDNNSFLQEAVLNPFYLNTASFLFDKGIKMDFKASNTEGVQLELINTFIYSQVPDADDKKYLGFLARKMNEDGFVVFELLKMQPIWCKSIWQYQLVIWLVVGFTFILASNLVLNFILGLISGLVLGLIYSFEKKISVDDIQIWSWQKFKKRWIISFADSLLTGLGILLIIGIIFCLIFVLKINFSFLLSWKIYFVVCLFGSMTYSLVIEFRKAGITTNDILYLSNPYERFINMLIVTSTWIIPSALLIIGVGISLRTILTEGKTIADIVNFMQSITFWKSSFLYFIFTLIFPLLYSNLLEHFALRIILWLEHKFPLRVVTFMDKMSEHLILEDNRVAEKQKDGSLKKGRGATWRFRHKILQDYFAVKWG